MDELSKIVREVIKEEFLSETLVLYITKNTAAAPNLGTAYGQDVEPHGTYVSQGRNETSGYINGGAEIRKPLLVNLNQDNLVQYKRELASQYKATGRKLTNKLMGLGYDAVVTKYDDGSYGEIILLPNASFMMA